MIVSILMARRVVEVNTDKAPAAVGPYSQALIVDNLVFSSGQIGLNPNSNALVHGIEGQTKQVLKNLENILQAAGCSLKDVIRVDVFLTNMDDFSVVNKIYESFFGNEPRPARQTVEVSALPKRAMIEISAIAYRHNK